MGFNTIVLIEFDLDSAVESTFVVSVESTCVVSTLSTDVESATLEFAVLWPQLANDIATAKMAAKRIFFIVLYF